jgi:predicted NACHT family NTPase
MDAETNIKFAEIFAPLIIKLLSTKKAEQKQDIHDVSEAVDRHITEVMNWANTFQFVGMGLPKLTDTGTIPLDFYTEARRFQSKSDNCSKIGEKELLSDTNHYLLLGEPGSGKTTTMRRISLALLREPASGEETIIQFPIVIRLRELKAGASIYNKLCDILGLIPTPFEFTVQFMDVDQYGKTIWIEQKKTEMRIGKYKVEDILSQVLNEIKALILLDGLDELQ